jgi:alanine racemase
VGYADGYRRELGGVTSIQINRRNYPIVGRISMDQMAVDVTGGDVQVGDAAVLISSDPQSDISMDRLAQRCRTIGYELATGLGSRLTRVLI